MEATDKEPSILLQGSPFHWRAASALALKGKLGTRVHEEKDTCQFMMSPSLPHSSCNCSMLDR